MTMHDTPPQEVLCALAVAGHRARRIDAYTSIQRHRSWRVSTNQGAIWIKLEAQESPVAGVEREALILRSLRRNFPFIPNVVLSGRDSRGRSYLASTELRGTPIGDAVSGGDWITGVAYALKAFGDLAAHLPAAARWRGSDLFGDHPHLPSLLRQASTQANDELNRLAGEIAVRTTSEPVVLVHGSFEPDNVIVDGRRLIGLLDLEAARLGPASYDVASMMTSLAMSAGPGRALEWLAACKEAIPGVLPINACGFMLLRACFRSAAGAVSAGERTRVLEVARRLAPTH